MTIDSPRSLAVRLTFWYALVFILFTGVALAYAYFSIDNQLQTELDDDLRSDVQEFSSIFEQDGLSGLASELKKEISSEDPEETFFLLYNSQDNLLVSSDMAPWSSLPVDKARQTARQSESEIYLNTLKPVDGDSDDTGEDARIAIAKIEDRLTLVIGESLEQQQAFMDLLLDVFLIAFTVAAVLAGLVQWILTHRALSGIDAVTRAAERFADGDLESRAMIETRSNEIIRLANTFNTMASRIRQLISGMRDVTDNIAHDLRSPLGRIRANAETALKDSTPEQDCRSIAADTLDECDRLMGMINSILDVAEAESGATDTRRDIVDLGKLVRDAVELFEPLAEDRNITLTVDADNDCHMKGNTPYLQRMLSNLIDNALKYTDRGGQVRVSLETADRQAMITVSDTGVGIARQDQNRVFERFVRVDKSRSRDGCGMGLSFARAVARAHGGDITLDSRPGQGSRFSSTLPIR